IVAEIEDEWDDAHRCEIDQSWDAIHRCLTDGTLSDSNGRFPLNAVILGGRQLIDAEGYTVAYVSAEHALAVADALDEIDEDWFRQRYQGLAQTDYSGPFGDEDADDAWDYLQDVRQFYADAVAAGRAVIFTVDA
ncbi:MAG TPA: DUF1877 family protein, partial [Micromonosporaceae bacterium]